MIQTITREKIERALKDGAQITLVEALPERYYAEAHLPSAININHDEVQTLAPSLLPNKDALIVVYCSNTACPNSGIAAQKLTQLGYTRVYKYAEGKQDWIEAGLPTEAGRQALSA